MEIPARRGGYNHWAGVADAPVLRTPSPSGNWAIEATLQLLDAPPEAEFHIGANGRLQRASADYLWTVSEPTVRGQAIARTLAGAHGRGATRHRADEHTAREPAHRQAGRALHLLHPT